MSIAGSDFRSYFRKDFTSRYTRIDLHNPKKRIEKRVVEINGKKYEFEFNVYDSQRCEEI